MMRNLQWLYKYYDVGADWEYTLYRDLNHSIFDFRAFNPSKEIATRFIWSC